MSCGGPWKIFNLTVGSFKGPTSLSRESAEKPGRSAHAIYSNSAGDINCLHPSMVRNCDKKIVGVFPKTSSPGIVRPSRSRRGGADGRGDETRSRFPGEIPRSDRGQRSRVGQPTCRMTRRHRRLVPGPGESRRPESIRRPPGGPHRRSPGGVPALRGVQGPHQRS